jgi:hypothetical protein
MTDIFEQLDRMNPPYTGAGDWSRVVADAGITPRSFRVPARLAFAAALAVALATAVAFWPSGGSNPSVIDRALAATGTGSTLHIVYETGLPHTLVDLATGERREVTGQHEVWFDPNEGLRDVETFDGVDQFSGAFTAETVPEHATEIFSSLGAGYRQALESGDARVAGEDTVDGTPVYWIRIAANHEVAVSKETYKPVSMRVFGGAEPMVNRILAYETIDPASAPFGEPIGTPGPQDVGEKLGPEIAIGDATALLGTPAVWAGQEMGGIPLTSVRQLGLPGANGDVPGVRLFYGAPDAAHVSITEAASPVEALTMLAGVRNYAPPEGTALLAGPTALVRSNGLVAVIAAPDEETAILIARSLVPYAG